MNELLEKLRNRLIVSVQALPGNPLRDTHCIARLAAAAAAGGAAAIRANGVEDLSAIRELVKLPIIAINKYAPSPTEPYITPDITAARQLYGLGEIIAVDATLRPDDKRAAELIARIHAESDALVMADISTLEEGIAAAAAGADIVATTLSGYTPYTVKTVGPDLELINALSRAVDVPVIAEGRFLTPEDVDAGLAAGAHSVVIGKMITNAMFITRHFIEKSTRLLS
ncbi:MAG: N-acetylmannosamine-6-phosphate 2-epimerase [Lentisphaeria bacterium]|jgi:N-acylglucosamine-6-phosphate 2-epimerase